MKKYDVIALGELLIDFTMNGASNQGNELFEANPGGAPCNVLSMLHNLGKKTAFIGKVGQDSFGTLLEETLKQIGIDTEGLKKDQNVNTTLAFVHTAPDGDRSFSFYRNPGADMMLREEEIEEDLIAQGKIFHFGTLSMTDELVSRATKKAVDIAKQHQLLISFDPNYRPLLWEREEAARDAMAYGMSQCDILKIADDELLFFTGEKDYEEGIRQIQLKYDIPLICLTLGKEGSRAYYRGMRVERPGVKLEHVTDTTGAGDTFCACVLNYVLNHDPKKIEEPELLDMLDFANAAAACITQRKGALKVMPQLQEINDRLH